MCGQSLIFSIHCSNKMLSSVDFHKAVLFINVPAWLGFVALFCIFAEGYAIEYAFGSVLSMAGAALCGHLFKKRQDLVDSIPYYPRFLLVSESVIAIGFCAIGLALKVNGDGGSAVFSFPLPVMLGKTGYDYWRQTRFNNKN